LTFCSPDPAVPHHVIATGFGRQQCFFLKLNPCLIRNFDNDAGWATTPCSARSLAASSGMVMSGTSSTQPARIAA
jgi:hypothetical protein